MHRSLKIGAIMGVTILLWLVFIVVFSIALALVLICLADWLAALIAIWMIVGLLVLVFTGPMPGESGSPLGMRIVCAIGWPIFVLMIFVSLAIPD